MQLAGTPSAETCWDSVNDQNSHGSQPHPDPAPCDTDCLLREGLSNSVCGGVINHQLVC